MADVGYGLLSHSILAELRDVREEYYQPATTRERRDELATSIGEKLAGLFPGFAEKAKGVKPTGNTQMDRENMRRQQDAYWLAEWFKHATIAAPFFNVETFFPELVTDGERNLAPFHIVIGNPPYGGTKIEDEVKDALRLGSKDPYGAFIARFLGDPARPSPLADGGVLAYIVSDTFMTIKTHRPLREQMLRHRVHKIMALESRTQDFRISLTKPYLTVRISNCLSSVINTLEWDGHGVGITAVYFKSCRELKLGVIQNTFVFLAMMLRSLFGKLILVNSLVTMTQLLYQKIKS